MQKFKLELSGQGLVRDIQQDFNQHYPYLKLDFYRKRPVESSEFIMERLPQTAQLRVAGVRKTGDVEVSDDMSVSELEHVFLDQFNVLVQVSRRSGTIWLETTMTNNWSLQKQNDYGKEISQHAVEKNSGLPGSR